MLGELDSLDQGIVKELRKDGRLAASDIARRLNSSETTVRKRIHRLLANGMIRVVAAVNFSKLGLGLHVIVGVSCKPGQVDSVVQELAYMPEVNHLMVVSGPFDIWVALSLRSEEDLFAFLTEKLGTIPGVQSTESMHILRMARRDLFFSEEAGDGDGSVMGILSRSELSE